MGPASGNRRAILLYRLPGDHRVLGLASRATREDRRRALPRRRGGDGVHVGRPTRLDRLEIVRC